MGAPELLGPYRMLSPIGAGGFGEVHLALDPEGRTVAVKVLHPHIAADEAAVARLAREVETMRRVRGPHVAEIVDAALTGDRPYLVTRYVQGRSLAVVVAQDGPLRGDALVRLAHGLAEALAVIHAAGVVHRDLKPANVLLADGEPYVIDFGIAHALDTASVTASGAVVGTPGYLAPEVLEGREAGPASDVFSWAATLAYAATGRQPYGTGPAPAVAYRVVHHEPDLDGVPDWLRPLLADCLVTDPEARPTAAELCERLGVAVPEPTETPPGDARTNGGPVNRLHEAETREWRPDMRRPRERRPRSRPRPPSPWAEHQERVHRRWVIGSGFAVALLAAAASDPLPEVAIMLLGTYGLAMLIDAGFGLAARSRSRVVLDLAAGFGAIGLSLLLTALFSPLALLLAVGTVVLVVVLFAFAG
ncbi:MAG TPA: serine/threonine-protein kinase [Natronosporangium sp.]|jgi:serine/threonine protein kinase|nr:MAG: serine/threonine protein kinase [Actinomycetota bacterium]